MLTVVSGTIVSIIQGALWPYFGSLVAYMLFSLMMPTAEQVREGSDKYCFRMFCVAITSIFTALISRFSFGLIAENITIRIRNTLYRSILTKHIGWFDDREN